MEMVAHDPAAAERVGVPQSVGKDFANADKGKKFAKKKKPSRRKLTKPAHQSMYPERANKD